MPSATATLAPLLALLIGRGAVMEIRSPSFRAGSAIPARSTCDGADASPALSISGVPAGARCLALVVDDPDAPAGTWVHWVAWNIPAGTTSIPENLPKKDGLPDGTRQGKNDFGRPGYGGPCPPSGTHRYFFRLYALDALLSLPATAVRKDLDRGMGGHILAQAELMGTYARPQP